MIPFIDDDIGYLHWLDENPHGFVINSTRHPTPGYLLLHRASCRTISGTPFRGSRWTADYRKTCSTSRAELEDWARREVGGNPRACLLCNP